MLLDRAAMAFLNSSFSNNNTTNNYHNSNSNSNNSSVYGLRDADCNYYDYDADYDYYNVADRASRNLSKPHYIIALIVGSLAVIANVFSLAALVQVRRAWSAHFRLLLSLMISDLLVALTVILYVINKVTNPGTEAGVGPVGMRLKSRCGFMMIKALNTMGLNITLLNLMGMALDHYLAVIKPLHHISLLDKRRVSIMIILFWVIAFVTGFSNFLSPMWEIQKYRNSTYNYCEYAWTTSYQEEYTMFTIALLCLCLMMFMYIRIYQKVHCRFQQEDMKKIARNRRALLTTFLILGSFMLCWLPTCLLQISLLVISHIKPEMLQNIHQCLLIVDKYFYDLLLLNTLCDPIIYVVRISDVKAGYRQMFMKCFSLKLHRNVSINTSRSDFLFTSRSSSVKIRSKEDWSSPDREIVGVNNDLGCTKNVQSEVYTNSMTDKPSVTAALLEKQESFL